MPGVTEERCDAVVVGAGVAGLRAAIAFAEAGARVLVVTKDPPDQSTSWEAQGGIAVALSGDEEDIVLHGDDTLRAGAGLCDEPAVRTLVQGGPDEVLQLIRWGARFDREGNRYHLTREAAHSAARILHAGGDATGREIVRTLVDRVRGCENVIRLRGAMVTDLLVDAAGRCAGIRVVGPDGAVGLIRSAAVLLATGGAGRCWERTSNPPDATGDGVALAALAGCTLGDMEFVQFHPTALALPGAPAWLLTEALRGEGAVVRDGDGRRFLLDADPRGELAPRDVVARGIARRIAEQGGAPAYLDISPMGAAFAEKRFPGILAGCRRFGLDPLTQPIPVAPAAHYMMGGVVTDLWGRTSIPGLAAAGEVASTGVHGANRLASNSLLEGLVFGARAAQGLLDDGCVAEPAGDAAPPPWLVSRWEDPEAHRRTLQRIAESELGILRDGTRLARAGTELERHWEALAPRGAPARITREAIEARSLVTVLRAVARAAAWRAESRGAHFREDYPARDDAAFRRHSRQALTGPVTAAEVA